MGASCCNPKDPNRVGGQEAQDLVTTHAFVEELARHSQRDEDGGKHVRVNIELIETILLQDEEIGPGDVEAASKTRTSNRNSTGGYISKLDVEDAVNTHVRLSQTSANGQQPTVRVSRVKDRKGTGFVTKEKLLNMLDDISDDEADDEIVPPKKPAATLNEGTAGKGSTPVNERCKERKGTGFVTKAKLKKVLVAVGEDEEE
mmetsp:Transcript_32944/g.102146  ORF Transcript_32944/g.102146 Transcript_32944/m.102146 type:complete len:202 (-) Transcript_32944:148-753(-)|eukprot:CAMPEP_0204578090 /NCGR_PEP_ID=MMETSP0661-20131031/42726_1 /ASSEMBLY_ACC=CAM_ASM_000606 /TAXON_ID=109239 /ORGANISM="Alexandrium margalefi, Strain AMGDE01CS-322" /LENGTH=201 /DNA_ID=CAMNT_0051586987 /DNA_START=50 /DNA_END=655 /DNA_ORIENTATION=+